jgi:glycosyltransferase involved in cell wall biosynthesis
LKSTSANASCWISTAGYSTRWQIASGKQLGILLPNLGGGGAEAVSVQLFDEFLRRGYSAEFVLMKRAGELLNTVPPASIRELDAPRYRALLPPLVRYLKQSPPEALLVSMWPLTCFAIWAAALARAPSRVVLCEHAIVSSSTQAQGPLAARIVRATMSSSYARADGVVAVSKGVARDIAKLSGLARDRIQVIYNPAARNKSGDNALDDPRVQSWQDSEHRLISVGKLKAVKDYPTLLRAFAGVLEQRDASLLILGEGECREALEQLAAELGIRDRLLMPGYVNDPYPYLAAADLFVLSSRNEGFGNVLVEAMQCGLPVVATDCESGPGEILDRGRYGTLTAVGDADAMSRAILGALDSECDSRRQKARAAEFGAEKAASAYLRLLFPAAG